MADISGGEVLARILKAEGVEHRHHDDAAADTEQSGQQPAQCARSRHRREQRQPVQCLAAQDRPGLSVPFCMGLSIVEFTEV